MQLTLTNDSPYEQWLNRSQEIDDSEDFWLTNGEILEKYQSEPYPQDFIHAYKLDEEMQNRIAEKRKLFNNAQEWADYVEYHIPTLDPMEEKQKKWQEGKEDRKRQAILNCGQLHFLWKQRGWKLGVRPWLCNRYDECPHCRKRLTGEREEFLARLIGHRLLVVSKDEEEQTKAKYDQYLRIPLDDGRIAFIVDDYDDVGYEFDHRCLKWLAEESISTSKQKGRMSGKLGREESPKKAKGEKVLLDSDDSSDNPLDEKYDYLDDVSFDELLSNFRKHLKQEQGGITIESDNGQKQEAILGTWEDVEPVTDIVTREFVMSPNNAISHVQLQNLVFKELELDINMPRTLGTLQYIIYQVEEKTKEIALRYCDEFRFTRKVKTTTKESEIDWSIFDKI